MSIWRAASGAKRKVGDGFVVGSFNYQSPSVPRSLTRTGKVYSARDGDGGTDNVVGVKMAPAPAVIRDARGMETSWHREGFELRQHDVHGVDFYDHDQVVRDYYPSACELVKQVTGGTLVFAFDDNIRSAQGSRAKRRPKGGGAVQPPAHVVHGDYTCTSAPDRLKQLTEPPRVNDTMRSVLGDRPLIPPEVAARALAPGGRFAFVNVWRSIRDEPVETFPLAICDSRTHSDSDLVVFEIRYADRIGENYFAGHSEGHSWSYFPRMKKNEALVFKCWDSQGAMARRSRGESFDPSKGTMCLHSAFADPSASSGAPDRESIEVRTIVVFDGADSPEQPVARSRARL